MLGSCLLLRSRFSHRFLFRFGHVNVVLDVDQGSGRF